MGNLDAKVSKEQEEKFKKRFQKDQEKITKDDLRRLINKFDEIYDKIISTKKFNGLTEAVKLMYEMVKDYYFGNYKDIPWSSIAAVAAALIYILNPFDVIPDFIPEIGYLDDIFIVTLALKHASKDIEQYRRWKNK
ncbi:conserved hypothetical protein (plasmid) [Deferribacter desulfuricans SSM1]|uniref:DUF1232 domain-containing protein n=1 Tax=Deferribacter desulfuricans (strain DSM 14783 / JCM 11476 / NBRC 101012 / SSM1) TaxID=639282 RepID=D3PF15_DEFDS|nr:YkvA family protein [Deferribacter desulfuricans]BAI81807.1 conserved hypothetical protein [Deferribacter desulfuricans SSM1]